MKTSSSRHGKMAAAGHSSAGHALVDAHPGAARYAMITVGVLALVLFALSAFNGLGTVAVIAGCVCVVAMASAMGLVGGTGHPDS